MIDLRKLRKIRTFGNSMYPLMKNEDVIHYRPIEFKKISVGDIVVVQKDSVFITHRVVYKNSSSVITKGDNNLKPDQPFGEKDIIGKVYMIQRGRKKVKIEELYLLQSSIYYKEICRLNDELHKARVKFVFLKGLPLHLYYERSYPRRVYADCDILINKKEKNKIEKIIGKFGYKKLYEGPIKVDRAKNLSTEINYFKVVNGIQVVFDIHFAPAFMMTKLNINHRFYDPVLLDSLTAHFLQNKRKIRIEHNQFTILQPFELVAYLALHFFHHNYRDMFRLQLIKEILQKDFSASNWNKLGKLIIKYKLQNFIFPVFILLQDYYKVRISSTFLVTIYPGGFLNAILLRRVKNSVFISQTRFQAGIERFFLLFIFSPQPLYKRLEVFVDWEVIRISLKLIEVYIIGKLKKARIFMGAIQQ